jgi:purine-binding chemotaxis protein CheW
MEDAMNNTPLSTEYVTFTVGAQLFGVPIGRVQDVFRPMQMTRVPLAPAEIAGILNLRGRLVTAIDLSRRLGIGTEGGRPALAVGIQTGAESFGLLVDAVGEVVDLPDAAREPAPVNLSPKLARVCAGVFRLEEGLLLLLDVDRVLDLGPESAAA